MKRFCPRCHWYDNECDGSLWNNGCLVGIGKHSPLLRNKAYMDRLHKELKTRHAERFGG